MSTTTTFDFAPVSTTSTSSAAPKAAVAKRALQRLFALFIAGREREARRRVGQFLAVQSDSRLSDLGFSSVEISELRRTGHITGNHSV